MPSQEVKELLGIIIDINRNTSLAKDLLLEVDKRNDNLLVAKSLLQQASFKYPKDISNCPFRAACREDLECEENEHEPIDVRGELD